jgi:hypothetical protein
MREIKVEFGFGTGFSGDGQSLSSLTVAVGVANIRARAVELFQGCTLNYTEGDWLDTDTSKVVSESGCTISVLAVDMLLTERINAVVSCIKTQLYQKAVAVTCNNVNFKIV